MLNGPAEPLEARGNLLLRIWLARVDAVFLPEPMDIGGVVRRGALNGSKARCQIIYFGQNRDMVKIHLTEQQRRLAKEIPVEGNAGILRNDIIATRQQHLHPASLHGQAVVRFFQLFQRGNLTPIITFIGVQSRNDGLNGLRQTVLNHF